MTHGVVQSDIEMAKRLIEAGCQDNEIVACLCWRGLRNAAALAIIDHLRNGARIGIHLPITTSRPKRPARSDLRRPSRAGRQRGTSRPIAVECAASREPLFFLYDRRPRVQRVVESIIRYTIGTLAALLVLSSLAYVGYEAYLGARKNFQSLDPTFRDAINRDKQDLLPTVYDDLKPPPPRP